MKLMAASQDGLDRQNLESLHAISLFGVPNHGMRIESLIPMMEENARRTLLYTVDGENSPVTVDLHRSFARVIQTLKDFDICCFYETQKSPTTRLSDG